MAQALGFPGMAQDLPMPCPLQKGVDSFQNWRFLQRVREPTVDDLEEHGQIQPPAISPVGPRNFPYLIWKGMVRSWDQIFHKQFTGPAPCAPEGHGWIQPLVILPVGSRTCPCYPKGMLIAPQTRNYASGSENPIPTEPAGHRQFQPLAIPPAGHRGAWFIWLTQRGMDGPSHWEFCQCSGPQDLTVDLMLSWKKERESESHSVLSDFLQSHGLYSPWNSPLQTTGVGSLSLLQGVLPNPGIELRFPPL